MNPLKRITDYLKRRDAVVLDFSDPWETPNTPTFQPARCPVLYLDKVIQKEDHLEFEFSTDFGPDYKTHTLCDSQLPEKFLKEIADFLNYYRSHLNRHALITKSDGKTYYNGKEFKRNENPGRCPVEEPATETESKAEPAPEEQDEFLAETIQDVTVTVWDEVRKSPKWETEGADSREVFSLCRNWAEEFEKYWNDLVAKGVEDEHDYMLEVEEFAVKKAKEYLHEDWPPVTNEED